MNIVRNIFVVVLLCAHFYSCAQKHSNQLGGAVVADSASTLMIPVLYPQSFSIKMGYGDFYANIIFYDFKTDARKKLFKADTHIKSFVEHVGYQTKHDVASITKGYIFYQVCNIDHNKNGRIDGRDPAILYVSDKQGNHLKALTPANENVVELQIFHKQDFALVKIQRDKDGNTHFDYEDDDYYLVRLDLTSLAFGEKIEVR